MEQDKTLSQALDETMDWLSDLSEDEIRQHLPEMRLPRSADFRWTIGGTEYTVVSHFKNDKADDVLRIVSRLMEDDLSHE